MQSFKAINFFRKAGYLLSFIGLILYCPPVVDALAPRLGEIGRTGGLVVFAIGWALLLANLAFALGIEKQKEELYGKD